MNINMLIEVRRGMFITVVKNTMWSDRSYVGNVLRVRAVSEPFIIVDRFHPAPRAKPDRLTIDTRVWEFKVLDEATVKEMLGEDHLLFTKDYGDPRGH